MPDSKCCSKCRQLAPISEFSRNSRQADGFRLECKLCQGKRHKEYYLRTRVLKGKRFMGADLSGQQCNRLTVISLAGKDRQNKPVWKCRCACGKEKNIRAKSLKSGNIKSCGCLAIEVLHRVRKFAIGAIRLPLGVSAARGLLCRYKRDARVAGRTWDLTDEEALSLMQQSCSYCGIEPRQVATSGGSGGNGSFLYNGIDRINPKLGYARENVCPCCKTCNTAKMQMTYGEFIDWINRVHHRLIGRAKWPMIS